MKNAGLIKGSAAIAVGAALLLGGGGTLAWWNASDSVAAGTVASGELNVVAGAGVWTDRAGNTVTISSYKVVPGDKLTFTQPLNVTLTGDKMAASLTPVGTGSDNGFDTANVIVSDLVLTSEGTEIANPLTASQLVTATITFEFKSSTANRADVGQTYDFGQVAFNLQQVTQDGLA